MPTHRMPSIHNPVEFEIIQSLGIEIDLSERIGDFSSFFVVEFFYTVPREIVNPGHGACRGKHKKWWRHDMEHLGH